MQPHEELIEQFHTVFQRFIARAMTRCYHADTRFSDPVLPLLSGPEASAMWQMLSSEAHWEARSDFSATVRRVDQEDKG
jgi:hypothetical protein